MKINEQNLENFAILSLCARGVLTPILVTSSLPRAIVFYAAQCVTLIPISLAFYGLRKCNFIEIENTKFDSVLKISIIAASIILGIKTQNKLLPINMNRALAAITNVFFEKVIESTLDITNQQDKSSTNDKITNLMEIFQNFGYLASLMFCPNLMVAYVASLACRSIPLAIEMVSRRFFQSQPQEA